MKKRDKKRKDNKSIKEVLDRVESVGSTISTVEEIQKTISDTIYIKGNIAVDLKNFSVMSIPDLGKN